MGSLHSTLLYMNIVPKRMKIMNKSKEFNGNFESFEFVTKTNLLYGISPI